MNQLRILMLGATFGVGLALTGCVSEELDATEPESEAVETATAEQSLSVGWYRVRWTVAGLYDYACGPVLKNFHAGHHVYVQNNVTAPPECAHTGPWVSVRDNYGNRGDMRANSLW
jgi:hypothetical protein